MRSQGWIVPDKFCVRLLLMTTVLVLLTVPPALAQQGNPEVYVDMSVLQGLGNKPAQAQPPVHLKPPAPRQPYSRLTAPAVPVEAPSAVQQQEPSAPKFPPVVAVPIPVPVTKPSPEAQNLQQAIRGESVQPQKMAPVSPSAPAKPQVRSYVSTPPAVPADPAPKPVQKIAEPSTIPAVPAKEVAAEPPALPPVKKEPAQIVAFPVKTNTKDETSDPSAPNSPSRPVPVRSGIAGNLKDVVPSRPAPDLDPSVPAESPPARDLTEEQNPAGAIMKPEPEKKVLRADIVPARKPKIDIGSVAAEKPPQAEIETIAEIDNPDTEVVAAIAKPAVEKPPIPPRRPETKQSVSPEVLADLIKKEQEKVKSGGHVDLVDPPPPPGPKGRKNMPAVAAGAVDAEPLSEQIVKLPIENDPLLDRLLEKDKADLVKTIETLVEQREDRLPAEEKKTVKKPDAGSSIFKAEPIQRPYNVYRPEKARQQRGEEQDKALLASLNAGGSDAVKDDVVPRPPLPRSEDEQAYVSLPFKDGITDLDDTTSREIESKLLPLLNDNPAWKLQIQAFASPIKDGTSSARKASLARAMSVRSFLLNKGIEPTRMDVRALGAESDRDPMDRVDLIVFNPAKKGS